MARKNNKANGIAKPIIRPEVGVTSTAAKQKPREWRASLTALCVFAILFSFITITSFAQKSPSTDEPIHLFAGYSYLKWGDFRSNPEHPPLAKLWAALPLLAFDINDSWQFNIHWDLIPQYPPHVFHIDAVAAEMLFRDNDANRLFFYAKLQMIALGILLGVFVYRWSKELYGFKAAMASLGIYCLDPNILAHSQIIHTDIAFSAVFFIGTYFFWRALSKLNWFNLVLAALFFGLAAITKYVYLEALLVWGLLGLLKIFSSQPERDMGLRHEVSSRWGKTTLLALVLGCSLVTAYVLIWSVYRWRFDAVPGGGVHFPMALELTGKTYLQGLAAFLMRHRLFPEAWIYGQLYVFNHLQRETYLLGSSSEHGSWLYFPVAFAVKTPVPTLLLFMATLAIWVLRWRDKAGERFLFVPVIVCFALAVFSSLNIGLRHILPIYPFLFVLIGGTAAELWRDRSRLKRGALAFLSLWYVASSISIYPHYLAFFNEIAGGAANGHKVLLDSNLDWGQDLKGLKSWVDQNGIKKIQFMYFGFHNIAEPRYYGINAIYLPGSWATDHSPNDKDSRVPDYLAVSANHLFGYLRGEQRDVNFVEPFKSLKPFAVIGYSIFIYRISDAIEQLRNAIRTNPNSAKSHADLGSFLENQGDAVAAMEHYRQAIRLDPSSLKALYNLGIMLVRRGEPRESIPYLRKALEINPADTDIRYDLALTLAVSGNSEEAIERLRETVNTDPNYTKAHYSLGMLLARRGAVEAAIKELRVAVYLDPTYSRAHYQLGVMLANRGSIQGAVGEFLQALQIEPEFVEAHESVGRALMLLGRKDEAIKHYEEAIRIIETRAASQGLP